MLSVVSEAPFQPFKFFIQVARLVMEILFMILIEYIAVVPPNKEELLIKTPSSYSIVIFPFGIPEVTIFRILVGFCLVHAVWFGILTGIQKITYSYNTVYPSIGSMSWFLRAWYEPIETFKKDIHAIGKYLAVYRIMIKKESVYYEKEFHRHYTIMLWPSIAGVILMTLRVIGSILVAVIDGGASKTFLIQICNCLIATLWKGIAAMIIYVYRKRYTQPARQTVY